MKGGDNIENSEKLDLILEKVSTLDEKVNILDTKVNALDEKVSTLDTRVNSLDEKVDTLDTKVNDTIANLQEIKQRVINTDLVIENEIRVNIQCIAEGNFGMSRNLYEVMRAHAETEVLSLKVRMLETDVKKLKEKLA